MQASTRVWVTLLAILVLLAALAMEISRHTHGPADRPAGTVQASRVP